MGILMGINFQYPNFKVCSEFLKAFSGKKPIFTRFVHVGFAFSTVFPVNLLYL